MEPLNNRELSLAIWLTILIIISLMKKEVRISILNVIKVFFEIKVFIIYLIMSFYIVLIILILHYLGFWNFILLKETIFWYFGVAFVSLVNANKVNQDENYFVKIIKDNLKMITILEFITTLYSFSLIIELFLVPLLLVMVLLSTFSEVKKEYYQVKKFVDGLLSIIGIFILFYAIYKIVADFYNFASVNNLTKFLLPPSLTFLFIPFLFLFALLMSYESLFVRLNFLMKNKDHYKHAKWKILISFHFRLRQLNQFSKDYYRLNEESNNDIVKTIKLFKE